MLISDKFLDQLAAGYRDEPTANNREKVSYWVSVRHTAAHFTIEPDACTFIDDVAHNLPKKSGDFFFPSAATYIEWNDPKNRCALYFSGDGTDLKPSLTGDVKLGNLYFMRLDDDGLPYSINYEVDFNETRPFRIADSLSHQDAVRHLRAQGKHDRANKLTALMTEDIRTRILATLGLLATPRLIHIEKDDLARLNKARVKRGNYPYIETHKVRLSLSLREEIKRQQHAETGAERMLHFVRAHWRFRLGQLEMVRPHWRGNPELGIKKPNYEVVS